MPKVKDIAEYIESLAPKTLAEPWDNVGLMVGDMDSNVESVYVTLDVTSENIEEAVNCGADFNRFTPSAYFHLNKQSD